MCLFCKIANHEAPARILFEDEQVVAFHDVQPRAPTHILIIPRKHIASMNDAERGDAELLGRLMLCATQLAQSQGVASSGYRLVLNTGVSAGQSVFHIHLHLIGGRRMGWPPG